MPVAALVAVWCAVGVLLALAVLQGLVASGKPYGRLEWGGAHEVLPPKLRIGSLVSCCGEVETSDSPVALTARPTWGLTRLAEAAAAGLPRAHASQRVR